MDNNVLESKAVPIHALLKDIEIVGDLGKKRRDYFVIVSIDDGKIAESEKKKSGESAPRWEWTDHQFLYHPSSQIKIMIYRKTKARVTKHVGQHTGTVVELLDNDPDATIDLKDENDAAIASELKIKITLSSVPQPENAYKEFMKTVDEDVLRIENSILASASNSSILGGLGTVLQSTYNIINALGIANAHPVLKASWTVMSAVYTAVKQTDLQDEMIRDLADTLREMLGVTKQVPNLLVIEGTDKVIEKIGRTSLKVASLIHEYTRLAFAGRAAKFYMSDDMKSRIEKCQKICKDLKEKFDRRVIIDTSHQVEIIKDQVEVIKDKQLAKEIDKWLAAPDSSRNYNEAREKYQKDTCAWFLDGDHFRKFREKPGFLWIKGKAGSGKTILSSSIIDKITKIRNDNPSITYAYFFFDGRDSQNDLQLHNKLIRSLILQLWHQCDGIPATLVKLYGSGHQQPSISSLEDVLYDIINDMRSTYVIIDSLDECIGDERKKWLLPWMKQIISRQIGTLHMAVVSRPEQDIADMLQPLNVRRIDLAEESTNHDIMNYLDQELSELETPWDEKTREIVKSTLTENADGMFRWVALQLMELKKCSNPSEVMEQLKALPKDLYKTYDRILLKADEKDRPNIKTFLRWLSFSVRPMELSEIAETVTVRFDGSKEPYYSPSHRYWNKKDVLKKCSGLILQSEGKVKLAHFSIKEYLLSDHLLKPEEATSYFHLTSIEDSHSLIAQTCLAYLLQFNTPNSVDANVATSFPLAFYAAEHGVSHAQSGGIDNLNTLVLAKQLFVPNGAIFTNWVRLWDHDDPYYHFSFSAEERKPDLQKTDFAPALYYTSLIGLHQVSLHLLSKEVDVDEKGGRFSTALQAASYQGYEAIVELLLAKGADVNAQGGTYGNALQVASATGHDTIVELLLAKRADVNAQGGYYGNALQATSVGGHNTIVELLLTKGADVNAQGGYYGNALQAASERGHNTIVELLLTKGADVNAQGGYYGNALQAASERGHIAIVDLLLVKGADVNAQGGRYSNALLAASYEGHVAIVDLLLTKGVDVNAQGGYYGNTLQAASARGHDAIVGMLLAKGADVNAQGGYYGNALQAASVGGHVAIMELLLAKGADVNAQGGQYGNALQAASYQGPVTIVELLLTKGADVNAQGGFWGNALRAASVEAHDEVVKLLLANGAENTLSEF